MAKTRKLSLLGALLLICAMILSACGGADATATTAPAAATDTPAAAGGEATATTATGRASGSSTFDPAAYKKNDVEAGATLRVSSWGDPSEQKVNQDALARFNQVYPDVKVTYEPQPQDFQTKLLAQISSGSEPDVFYVDPGLGYQLIPAGTLLPLDDTLSATGRSPKDYFPALIQVFTGKDGKIYGLPKDFGSLAVFYNTDLVKNPPKADWTQDDFTKFVKENVSGSGATQVFGLSTNADVERWGAFALANGAKIIDNGKCAINSQAGVDTLAWWYGLYKDKVSTQPSDVGAGWNGEAFAKKRVASAVEGGWMIPYLQDPKAAFGVNFDGAPLPKGKTGTADLLFFNAWAASAKSKYPKAAAALVAFLASKENEGAILQTGFALPAIQGMENDPFFQGTGVVNKISKIIYQTGSIGTASYYGGVNDPKIKKALNDATTRVFAGQQDAKAALDQACQEIDPLLAASQ